MCVFRLRSWLISSRSFGVLSSEDTGQERAHGKSVSKMQVLLPAIHNALFSQPHPRKLSFICWHMFSVSVVRHKNPDGDIFSISEAAVSSPTKALSSNCISGGGSLAASRDLHFETFANVMTLGTRHSVKGTSQATRTRGWTSLLLS